MARKYTRDNRGRFASKGGGATARGGRLKTASGNKRQSQTMQAKGGKAGTIGKPKGLKPGAIQARAAAKPAAKPASKPFSKVQFDHAAFMRRSIRRDTAPGIREAYATQGGRKPTALEAKKIDRAKQTSARARKFDSTPTRDRVVRSTSPKAAKPAASKVDTTAAGIARRRARAMTERSSVAGGTFNMKLTTQSAITRSAANAIYNRQRVVARASGGKIDPSIARDGIGVVRGISGSRKDRAQQLREQARKRVVGGRRR